LNYGMEQFLEGLGQVSGCEYGFLASPSSEAESGRTGPSPADSTAVNSQSQRRLQARSLADGLIKILAGFSPQQEVTAGPLIQAYQRHFAQLLEVAETLGQAAEKVNHRGIRGTADLDTKMQA
jgi:hypothetical protein